MSIKEEDFENDQCRSDVVLGNNVERGIVIITKPFLGWVELAENRSK